MIGPACDLERYYDGPMCGSDWLDQETNDKILTRHFPLSEKLNAYHFIFRLIIREEGVCVPDFVAFVKPPIPRNKRAMYKIGIEKEEIISLNSGEEDQQINGTVRKVLSSPPYASTNLHRF